MPKFCTHTVPTHHACPCMSWHSRSSLHRALSVPQGSYITMPCNGVMMIGTAGVAVCATWMASCRALLSWSSSALALCASSSDTEALAAAILCSSRSRFTACKLRSASTSCALSASTHRCSCSREEEDDCLAGPLLCSGALRRGRPCIHTFCAPEARCLDGLQYVLQHEGG